MHVLRSPYESILRRALFSSVTQCLLGHSCGPLRLYPDHVDMILTLRAIAATLIPVATAFHAGTRTGTCNCYVQREHPTVARTQPSAKERITRGIPMSIDRCSLEVTAAEERDDSIRSPSANRRMLFERQGQDDYAGKRRRGRERERRRLLSVPSLVLAATSIFSEPALAAVTGGRIGGGYNPPAAERTPSAPPLQQEQRYQAPQRQQQYPPRAGRDIYGSEGSRFHITYDGGRMGRRATRIRFNPDSGDVVSSTITPGDVAMVGGVSAAVAVAQRHNRRRFLEEENEGYGRRRSPARTGRADPNKQTAVVTTLQLSLYCDRNGGLGDVLATLDNLSQTADVNSPRGLSTLINEVRFAHV